ncbi:MAG: Asp-tRNA(Asn)/Glu-tRNA(Gln) amidotransferase subunit GatC [Dehalococcoidia bacterium]|nr:Asp-tRNA(Asn)/Glu-tRNA(Gln) amidotransferase subunit GatC [Dehalococcoidia bacterium]
MPLTKQDVIHVATLCRIALTPAEVEQLSTQLSNILEQFEVLKELDTAGVPPTSTALPLVSVMRDDEPRDASPKEDVLQNAPARQGDFFSVRLVLEES